jgi:hypothetical protein
MRDETMSDTLCLEKSVQLRSPKTPIFYVTLLGYRQLSVLRCKSNLLSLRKVRNMSNRLMLSGNELGLVSR